MANENFILKVPLGSVIIGNNFKIKLKSIPDEAFELWQKGQTEFELTKEGAVLLEKLNTEELKELIKLRTPIGYVSEISILKEVLKSLNSQTKPKK